MRITRYNDGTRGKVISMRCRRSINNREMIVLDNSKLEQVYVYGQSTVDATLEYLREIMNVDIRPTDQLPVQTKLVNHESLGEIYQIRHEEEDGLDDYHAFFAPLDDEE